MLPTRSRWIMAVWSRSEPAGLIEAIYIAHFSSTRHPYRKPMACWTLGLSGTCLTIRRALRSGAPTSTVKSTLEELWTLLAES